YNRRAVTVLWRMNIRYPTASARLNIEGRFFMGQKVRPTGFRTGIMTDWSSQWYANKQDFAELLVEDKKIRDYIKKRYARSGIARIKIDRTREKVTVYIYSHRVGMIIGKKGQEVDKLTKELETLCHRHIEIKTMEVNRPEVDPQLVGE